ncbi:MAG: RNA polymerase sigma factor [bacterium]
MVEDEKELVEKVINGDQDAIKQLIEDYQRLVASIVWKMTYNEFDREDLCQEIMIKVYKNISKFRFQSKLSTWIGRISYNHCYNFLNKKKRMINFNALDHLDPDLIGHSIFVDDCKNSGKEIVEDNIEQILLKCLDKLPPVYKLIINLYHFENLSYNEIAEITDMPMGTVKSYLYRGREKLKDILQSNYSREEITSNT